MVQSAQELHKSQNPNGKLEIIQSTMDIQRQSPIQQVDLLEKDKGNL